RQWGILVAVHSVLRARTDGVATISFFQSDRGDNVLKLHTLGAVRSTGRADEFAGTACYGGRCAREDLPRAPTLAPLQQDEYLVQQRYELREIRRVQQIGNRAKQVAEQITRARNRRD